MNISESSTKVMNSTVIPKKALYNTFLINKKNDKNDKLNSSKLTYILRNTKSILENGESFFSYINSYTKNVEISTFMTPNIRQYPILRKDSKIYIPLSRKINTNRVLKPKILKKQMNNEFHSNFEDKLRKSMSEIFSKNCIKNIKNKINNRYNILFKDFFL